MNDPLAGSLPSAALGANDEALKKSELRYRRLFETAQDGILILDFNTGIILDANKFLIDLLGYSKDEFLEKHLWEVGVFKNIAATKENFAILQNTHFVRFENLPLETHEGKRIDVEFVANAYAVGEQQVIQCNIRDITDRKRAEQLLAEAKAQDDAILAFISDAVIACNLGGVVVLLNHKAEELTGLTAAEAIGQPIGQVLAFVKEADGQPGNDFISEAISQGKTTSFANHALLVRKDGKRLPVTNAAAPVRDSNDKIIGVVVVFHDSAREREVDKQKTEFVSLASHQMRDPLGLIRWNAEMLLSGEAGGLTDSQRQLVTQIHDSGRRMIDLINVLLDVSRLELGTLDIELEPVDVVKSAQTSISEYRAQIDEKKIILEEKFAPGIAAVPADPRLLNVIIGNLLSNAVKYTPAGGKIMIEILPEGENLLIKVADTGVGIPADHQAEIFTKLFRADNAKEIDPHGTGLGLYIVKEILDHTKGSIRFESEEGKGTVFFATIPLSGMAKSAKAIS